jgi:hypothetical protein
MGFWQLCVHRFRIKFSTCIKKVSEKEEQQALDFVPLVLPLLFWFLIAEQPEVKAGEIFAW